MIYYECYHVSKSYNFNTKLNYIFNNMEHQALVIFVMVLAPLGILLVRVLHTRFPKQFVDPHFVCLGFVVKPISNMHGNKAL
jgi:hypothetical protein